MADPQAAAPDVAATIFAALDALRGSFASRLGAAATEQALRDENAKILGKKGELTAILKQLGAAPPESRRAIGEKVNVLKQEVEKAFEDRLAAIHHAKRDEDLHATPFDLTLPGRPLAPIG